MKKLTESAKYIIWIEGCLGELQREGAIAGGSCGLSKSGWKDFEQLKREKFSPVSWKLTIAAKEHPNIPKDIAPAITALILEKSRQ